MTFTLDFHGQILKMLYLGNMGGGGGGGGGGGARLTWNQRDVSR